VLDGGEDLDAEYEANLAAEDLIVSKPVPIPRRSSEISVDSDGASPRVSSLSFLTASQAITPITRELSNVQEFLTTIPSSLGGSGSASPGINSLTQSQVHTAQTYIGNLRV
jgi:hypothetical protein